MAEDSRACMSERDILYTQRALIAAKTQRDVKAPAVQIAADIVLDVAAMLVRLPPLYAGQIIIDFDGRGQSRLRQTADILPIDKP